jgi:hypothetical protein
VITAVYEVQGCVDGVWDWRHVAPDQNITQTDSLERAEELVASLIETCPSEFSKETVRIVTICGVQS